MKFVVQVVKSIAIFVAIKTKHMKKIVYLIAFLPFVVACGGGNNDGALSVEDSLTAVSGGQAVRIDKQDSSIQSFIRGFNEIQDNLDEIKAKEKIVSENSKDPEVRKTKEQQIVDDIQSIYDIMNKNKQRLASMKSKLKESNKHNDELEKFIARLTTEIEEKDAQINDLKGQLERLNVEMTALNLNYEEAIQESSVKTEKLNTAYYAFGTSKELIKNNVLTKEGGFIGMGKTAKMKADFNKGYFTKVDITSLSEITLGAKKAKFITTHPIGSYKIEGAEGKAEKLVIINSEEFWSASKYLVIVVE